MADGNDPTQDAIRALLGYDGDEDGSPTTMTEIGSMPEKVKVEDVTAPLMDEEIIEVGPEKIEVQAPKKRGPKPKRAEEKAAAKAQRKAKKTEERPNSVNGYADRIVALEREKKEVGESIKDIYSEAKEAGHNPRLLKQAIGRLMQGVDKDVIQQENRTLNDYLEQLGLL